MKLNNIVKISFFLVNSLFVLTTPFNNKMTNVDNINNIDK